MCYTVTHYEVNICRNLVWLIYLLAEAADKILSVIVINSASDSQDFVNIPNAGKVLGFPLMVNN